MQLTFDVSSADATASSLQRFEAHAVVEQGRRDRAGALHRRVLESTRRLFGNERQ
jgi:hypothetical protein